MRKLTIVSAPGVPPSEVKALELHYREAIVDPSYTLVVNYPIYVQQVDLLPLHVLIISADTGAGGLTDTTVDDEVTSAVVAKELVDLRNRFGTESEKPNGLIVVNYAINIQQIPVQ